MKHSPSFAMPIPFLLVLIIGCAPVAASLSSTTAMTPATSVPTTTPPPTPRPVPYVLWTFRTKGDIWSSPAISDGGHSQNGMVYIGSDDGCLYAVDIQTGQERWKFETGDNVRSRPTIVAGVVYFASDDGYLYALDAETGQELWRFDTQSGMVPRVPFTTMDNYDWDYQQSSPSIANGVVYVGSANGDFYAVDAQTGQEVWRFKTGNKVRSSPAIAEGIVYFGSWDHNVYALDAQTGQERWRFSTGGEVQPSPTIVDGVVYVGSRRPFVYALNAQTGQELWRFRLTDNPMS